MAQLHSCAACAVPGRTIYFHWERPRDRCTCLKWSPVFHSSGVARGSELRAARLHMRVRNVGWGLPGARVRRFAAAAGTLCAGLALTIVLHQGGEQVGKGGRMGGGSVLAAFGILSRMTSLMTSVPLPDAFDVRWGASECRGFIPMNREGNWGSTCQPGYAMLVSAMLSARTCRNTRGTLNLLLSAQSIIDCYQDGDGCADGTVEGALKTLEVDPAVDSICMPLQNRPGLGYVSLPGKCGADTCAGATGYYVLAGSRGTANASFDDGARVILGKTTGAWVYKSGINIAVPQSVERLQRAILDGGPVLGKINYYKNSQIGIRTDPLASPISTFADSIPELYYGPGPVADGEAPDGVHDVLVLGWGRNRDGIPYWLVMDTIGECYGEHGVFKIAMGVNAGNFEGYGFLYADLDVTRATQDLAVTSFMGGCADNIKVHGLCLHSGILSSNGCQCQCDPRWAGPRCEICSLQCKNGGIINNFQVLSGGSSVETCRCDCPKGFSGQECESRCPNMKAMTDGMEGYS